jgi:hypothetical protein
MNANLVVPAALVLSYMLVPGLVAITRGRARKAVFLSLGLGAALFVLLRVVVGRGAFAGAAVMLINGLVIGAGVAPMSNPRLPFRAKFLAMTAVTGLLTLQWSALIPGKVLLTHDLANHSLVAALETLHLSPQDPAVDLGVQQLLPSLNFAVEHPFGVAVFLTWVSSYILLIALYAAVPSAFEPNVAPWSRLALTSLRMPWRRALPAALLVTWLASRYWPALVPVADALLGTYAAWAVAGLALAALSLRSAVAPVVALLACCSLYLPLTPLLSLLGVVDHLLELRSALPSTAEGAAAAPFRGVRSVRRYLAFFAMYLMLVVFINPDVEGEAEVAQGPFDTSAAPEPPGAAPSGMVFQPLPAGTFWIDEDEFRDQREESARANVTHSEAASLCAAANKRLCSEQEWVFACEGPEFRGRPDDVRAMIGGVWEWTAAPRRATPSSGYHVLKGAADDVPDGNRRDCRYRFFVHERQQEAVDLSRVGLRCCLDAP